MKIKNSFGDRVLIGFCYAVITLFSITVLLPFWNLLVTSVTPKSDITIGFKWITTNVDWAAWGLIFKSSYMWTCFWNTVVRTVLGTIVALIVTVTFTYPISIKTFPLSKPLTILVTITMFFNPGLIPNYLNITNLGMIDKIWALILPGAMSAFNVILLKNFFNSIPASIIESGKMDGANDIIILFRLVLPLSLPILATLALWTIVGQWNSWFDVLLYINSRDKYVLQMMLRELSETIDSITKGLPGSESTANIPSDAVVAASNLFVILPIICTYPFLQKYFIKGITVGAVKE